MARENPNKYPPRMGMPWSSSEKHNLIMDLKMGKSIERIAAEHQRTVGGINSYRKKMVEELYSKGKQLNEIREITRFTIQEIEYFISKITSKEENEARIQELQDSFPSFGKNELETVSKRVAEILKDSIISKLERRIEALEKSQTSSTIHKEDDTTMFDVWDVDEYYGQ